MTSADRHDAVGRDQADRWLDADNTIDIKCKGPLNVTTKDLILLEGGNAGAILQSKGDTSVRAGVTNDLYLQSQGVTYKWPTADGTAGQVLQTDGAGNLSWYTIP